MFINNASFIRVCFPNILLYSYSEYKFVWLIYYCLARLSRIISTFSLTNITRDKHPPEKWVRWDFLPLLICKGITKQDSFWPKHLDKHLPKNGAILLSPIKIEHVFSVPPEWWVFGFGELLESDRFWFGFGSNLDLDWQMLSPSLFRMNMFISQLARD